MRNPFDRDETAIVRLVAAGRVERRRRGRRRSTLDARGEARRARSRSRSAPSAAARAVAADLTVGETRFGQQAEALVDVA